MERRNLTRSPLEVEVLLCCHSFGMVRGTTRNISLDGVYVATNHLSMAENDKVDVCFMTQNENIKSMHKVGAKVARVNSNGIGLSFTDTLLENIYETLS